MGPIVYEHLRPLNVLQPIGIGRTHFFLCIIDEAYLICREYDQKPRKSYVHTLKELVEAQGVQETLTYIHYAKKVNKKSFSKKRDTYILATSKTPSLQDISESFNFSISLQEINKNMHMGFIMESKSIRDNLNVKCMRKI